MYNYFKRTEDYKLYVSKGNEIIIMDIPIQTFLNNLLKKALTDLTSREKTIKKVLGFKSKVPIYIDKNNLFMCIKSYRLENSFYINYFSIVSYEYIGETIIINFRDKHSIKLRKKHVFQMQIDKCRSILNYLN
ncbi:MAG: competence protein ComK [Tenericutes bacterium]|nr:competence protein ComK [Mycoplasmatota bacterium]